MSYIHCEAGNKPYSAFGHSALRFTDSINGFDVVFNYGAFNLSENEFYINFLKNNLTFFLVIERIEDFLNGYIIENRKVTEIPIFIPKQQKQNVFDFLMWNALAENAPYQYNFFTNNCATKLRDVLMQEEKGSIKLNFSSKKNTFRVLINKHLADKPWLRMLIYFFIGVNGDKNLTGFQATFLPDDLRLVILNSVNIDSGIIGNEKVILDNTSICSNPNFIFHPNVVISLILLSLLSTVIFNSNFLCTLAIAFAMVITGSIGLVLCYLWFLTSHELTTNNLNILWAFPLNFIVGITLFCNKHKWKLIYLKYFGYWLLGFGFLSFFCQQELYPTLKIWIPLLGLIFIINSHKLTLPK